MQDPLQMKGIREGILVTVDTDTDWSVALVTLATRIDNQSSFFKGARLVFQLDSRAVQRTELERLQTVLDEREVGLAGILSESATTLGAAHQLELAVDLETIGKLNRIAHNIDDKDIDEVMPFPEQMFHNELPVSSGVLVHQTIRSGRIVRNTGHIVVIGDVNPGAEVIAGGDIIVWGKARGMVHAGALGDESCVICALELQPTQLRIASHISISPPKGRRRRPRPEQALVRDGQIEADPWQV